MTEPHVAVDAEPSAPADRPTPDQHAMAMAEYMRDGTRRAYELGNRGPIRFNDVRYCSSLSSRRDLGSPFFLESHSS